MYTRLPELAWHRTRSRGRLPFWVFFLPPLRVLTEMTSGIQSTDHWEKEENMPNSRDCSRICWWQGLPVAAWAPPPPPSLNKDAKSPLSSCRYKAAVTFFIDRLKHLAELPPLPPEWICYPSPPTRPIAGYRVPRSLRLPPQPPAVSPKQES